jgi:hypothetical protein
LGKRRDGTRARSAGLGALHVVPTLAAVDFGNQAGILHAWGRLEEALALRKKEEALCRELGTRRDLAYCYREWGLLAREQRDRNEEREKLAAALDIFTELNMPA